MPKLLYHDIKTYKYIYKNLNIFKFYQLILIIIPELLHHFTALEYNHISRTA